MFTLALALGRTVGELEASMSVDEFRDWQKFNAEAPIGLERMDYGFGLIAMLIAAVNRKQGTPARPLRDFLLFAPEPTPEEEKAALLREFGVM